MHLKHFLTKVGLNAPENKCQMVYSKSIFSSQHIKLKKMLFFFLFFCCFCIFKFSCIMSILDRAYPKKIFVVDFCLFVRNYVKSVKKHSRSISKVNDI